MGLQLLLTQAKSHFINCVKYIRHQDTFKTGILEEMVI